MTGLGPSDGAAFLPEREPLSWTAPAGFPASLRPAALYLQDANPGLEVAVATGARSPGAADLRAAWKKRQAGRPNPVLLVALYATAGGHRAALCGPGGEHPPVHSDVALSQARRLAAAALGEPTHQAATRFLVAALGEVRSEMPGLRNVGLLATQQLLVTAAAIRSGERTLAGGPATAAVVDSPAGHAAALLGLRGRPLVEALGFEVQVLAIGASLLRIDGRGRAVAVFCDEGEPFDAPAGRFDGTSPVSRGLALADTENLDWLVLTRGAEIRLYAARGDVGVGRKGRAESFVELNLALLADDLADFLPLLFSADALRQGGSLEVLLAESAVFAADLAKRLRERVYYKTVPSLAGAVARRMGPNPSPQDLDDAYEQVMVILFRLLFVAYAEDSDLLPYRSNDRYADHSLKKMARRLADERNAGRLVYDAEACDDWEDVRQLWRAVDRGNRGWGVPAYNGGLFSSDPAVSRAGAAVARLELPDAEFAPALADLLVDEGESRHEGWGPVDFRSLSVREFGTIYEGLLESRLAVAASDLTVRKVKGADTYVPAGEGDDVEVAAGGVYLHNRSGVRKATGSYFTKPFAVEHLLDHALEPALDDHIARLEALRETGDDAALAGAFFDFRCADIAMGSGHFLVAALDRIEARLSGWLARHPVPAVTAELNRLRDTALAALGDAAASTEIETGSLLRRQVARHCVYGVDRNRVAVELARLSIWVHTFVPGLPLSLLDHNLICGDSLTGVGTLDEAVAALDPDADPEEPSLFRDQLEALLRRAEGALVRLADTADADKAEIDDAREAQAAAWTAVAPARALFDLITAHRASGHPLPQRFDEATLLNAAAAEEVRAAVSNLKPVHFPAAFPEVFLRNNPGFDCLLGNPPWEQVVVQEHVWWGIHLPRIRSLPIQKMNAAIAEFRSQRPDLEALYEADVADAEQTRTVLRSAFPHLGAGRTDLYKAFGWANLGQAREGGRIGLILPRSAISSAGMADWRRQLLAIDSALLNFGGLEGDDGRRRATTGDDGRRRATTGDDGRRRATTGDDGQLCPWRRCSTTRVGCSRTSTSSTPWRCWRSRGDVGPHVSQHPTVGLRRRRPSVHRHPHFARQAILPAETHAQGVALSRHRM